MSRTSLFPRDSRRFSREVLSASAPSTSAVISSSYWYLRHDERPTDVDVPPIDESRERVLEVALRMKEARESGNFDCPDGGCRYCEPYERIRNGEGTYIGSGDYGDDLYVLR